MSATATPQLFSHVSAVDQIRPDLFGAELDPAWTVLGKPNGGYLQAIMTRAAATGSPHPHVVAASTHYLRAPEPGPVLMDVEVLRSGRGASQVRVRLLQDDVARAETVVTLADLTEVVGEPTWASERLPAPGVAREQCLRLAPPAEMGIAILHQVELHLEPDAFSFATGSPRGLGELRGWLGLPGGQDFDPYSLLLAADVLPPATMDINPSGWVPTLELSTYVRALPAPGPVHVVMVANLIHGDRVDETCTVRDSTGQVVAQSHQLAGIRFA